jgi:hypothetical protein
MNEPTSTSDPMFIACEAVLRDIASYPVTSERLLDALPLIKEAIAAIRAMDEADVKGLEPMTVMRLAP